jgi:hypothetical protein
MNVNDFNSHPLETRINEILEWGFSLNKFHVNDHVLVRYSLHHFFAVMILRHSDGAILDVKAFHHDEIRAENKIKMGEHLSNSFR